MLFLILPLLFFIFKKRNFPNYRFICWGLLSAAILFFLSYPFFFLSSSEVLNSGDITLSGSDYNVSSLGGQGFYIIFRKFLSYDPAIFILTVISLIFLFSAKRRLASFLKADAFGIPAYGIVFLAIFGSFNVTSGRFLIPLILPLVVLSGVVASRLLDLRSLLGIIFLSLLCLFSLAQVLRMTYLIGLPDTRALATRWVKEYLTDKDIILIDAQNIATPFSKEGILLGRELGGSATRRDELLLSLPDEDYPKDARNILRSWQLRIPDYEKFIKENNITHIIVSDGGGFRSHSNPLFDFAEENFELREVFSPFRNQSNSVFSNFPDELSDPIIDLWEISKMGPEVRIYEKP